MTRKIHFFTILSCFFLNALAFLQAVVEILDILMSLGFLGVLQWLYILFK